MALWGQHRLGVRFLTAPRRTTHLFATSFATGDDNETGKDWPVTPFGRLLALAEHNRRCLDGLQRGGETGVHGHLQDNLQGFQIPALISSSPAGRCTVTCRTGPRANRDHDRSQPGERT